MKHNGLVDFQIVLRHEQEDNCRKVSPRPFGIKKAKTARTKLLDAKNMSSEIACHNFSEQRL